MNDKTQQTSSRATLIIPAYNEAKGIVQTLDRLTENPALSAIDILVVDDGSTDETPLIVGKYKQVQLIRHPKNLGYGAALKTGIRAARTEKLIIMDSDGQHTPHCIPEIDNLLDRYPLVIGERTAGSFQVKTRTMGKKFIRWVAEFLMEQELPDFNSGFRGFRRSIILHLLHMMPNGFSFSTTSTLAFMKLGFQIGTIPIEAKPRIGRPSSVRFFSDGLKAILLVLRIIMLFNPLKIFFPVSLCIGSMGILWATIGYSMAHRIPNSAVLLGILGMFLFFFGLLADQVSIVNLKNIFPSIDDNHET